MVAVLLGIRNFANQMGQAILVLLATQTLHVSTRGYGLLLAASAVGSVVGGLVNPVLTRRLGLLSSLILPSLLEAAAFAGIGLAPDPAVVAALLAVQGVLRRHVERGHGQSPPTGRPRSPARPGQQRLPHAGLGPDAVSVVTGYIPPYVVGHHDWWIGLTAGPRGDRRRADMAKRIWRQPEAWVVARASIASSLGGSL
ncbi:MAG: hypothetical protein ACRDPY_22975 [Streptosporangiaceae bacterium]